MAPVTNASWMPLKYFYWSRILNITHRAFNNLELCDINSLVVKNASSNSLRKSLNVVVSRPRTERGGCSFKHKAAIAWNSLPDTIKQLENPHSFKTKLKTNKTYVRDISFQKECSVNCNKNPEFAYFKIIWLVFLSYKINICMYVCTLEKQLKIYL